MSLQELSLCPTSKNKTSEDQNLYISLAKRRSLLHILLMFFDASRDVETFVYSLSVSESIYMLMHLRTV
jgi:hypothetical protein